MLPQAWDWGKVKTARPPMIPSLARAPRSATWEEAHAELQQRGGRMWRGKGRMLGQV